MEILTGEQMRRGDRRAIDELGISSLTLMEAAGRGVATALVSHYPDLGERGVVILCGKGNNGGDGLVAARYLATHGIRPYSVLLARADELSPDATTNLRAARAAGLEVAEAADEAAWDRVRAEIGGRLVIDAMLGTGTRGQARGLIARVIEDLGRLAARVVAIDLPSGLDADSHRVPGAAIRAERTYTLVRPKLALALEPASAHAGRWTVVPIGIPDDTVQAAQPTFEWLDRDAASALLPARARDAHKGTQGHLLAVAGSRGKTGAAVLLARAALRAGVGLITVATPASCLALVAGSQAELMTAPLPEGAGGALSRESANVALELVLRVSALALGPGLGGGPETAAAAQEIVRRAGKPLVIDADGLNALAADGEAAALTNLGAGRAVVLTPHPGEAGRLLGWPTTTIQDDRVEAIRELLRRSQAVVVLKGHRTLVAAPDGRVAINGSGNPGLATAGTGDVLTGVIGAFLARGLDPWSAARLAVFVHGDAGDRAAARRGTEGLIASDVVRRLPASMAALRAA